MFTFVMDVIIVVLKSVMIFLPRRWWKIILFGEKTEQYHLQDMKNGFRLTSTLSKLSSDFNQNLKLKKQTFVFKFVSVPAKWINTSRRHVLNIYTDNHAYAR